MNTRQNVESLNVINIYSTGQNAITVHVAAWYVREASPPKLRDCPIGEVNSQDKWQAICEMAKFFGVNLVYLHRLESTTSISIQKAEALGLGGLCELLDEAS